MVVACSGLTLEVETVKIESFPSLIAPGETVILIDGSGFALGDAKVCGRPAVAEGSSGALDRMANAEKRRMPGHCQRMPGVVNGPDGMKWGFIRLWYL